ncbi:MAG: hypothetical protein U1E02_23570, partial [Hydrogenophaga sp.]|nr:hypothetical protein [Hydrogenophaga sp.]
YNAGTNLQVLNCTVTAGATGNITATAPTTINNAQISIGYEGTITTGIGGIGILNTANNIYIDTCIATGGASCSITKTNTGANRNTNIGSPNGYVLTAPAGDAILTTTNSRGTITDCVLSTTNGGSVTVVASNKYGSADGSAGGNGINCNGANNLLIVNCLIKQTGSGGNGYRGANFFQPLHPGNGGNGGVGILVQPNCTNTQIANSTITNTGIGGTTGGAPATNGAGGHGIIALGQKTQINNNTIAYTGSSIDSAASGLAISCTDEVASAVYTNFAHNIAASTAYFLAGIFPNSCAVDSTSGTAFTAITYPLQNIYKP